MLTCKTVKVTIAEKEFELAMNFRALSIAERLTGDNFLLPNSWELTTTRMVAVFYGAAKQTDKELTLEVVESLGLKHTAAMIDACRKAWLLSNEADEEPKYPTDGPA